jgi:hypothetical protein
MHITMTAFSNSVRGLGNVLMTLAASPLLKPQTLEFNGSFLDRGLSFPLPLSL